MPENESTQFGLENLLFAPRNLCLVVFFGTCFHIESGLMNTRKHAFGQCTLSSDCLVYIGILIWLKYDYVHTCYSFRFS